MVNKLCIKNDTKLQTRKYVFVIIIIIIYINNQKKFYPSVFRERHSSLLQHFKIEQGSRWYRSK